MQINHIHETQLKLKKNSLEEFFQNDSNFPILIFDAVLQDYLLGYVDWHWHKEFQFCYVTEGCAIFTVNNTDYTVPKGDGFFINSGLLHSIKSYQDKATSYSCLEFAPSLISLWPGSVFDTKFCNPFITTGPEVIHFHKNNEKHQTILSLLKKITTSADSLYTNEYEVLIEILTLWNNILNITSNLDHNRRQTHSDSACIMMIDYIHMHWNEKIQLDDIANHVSYSRNECCRQFKAIFHKTIFEYINEYRIRQSIDLITNTSMSITQIAYTCGFGSSSYFIFHFKKNTGKTPLDYRK